MYLRKLYHLTLLTTVITLCGGVVRAQTLSDEQISNYAQAVMQIESNRQQAYAEIQQIMGENPPDIVCNQPSSYNSLPEDAAQIAIIYCQTSENIVKDTGMTVEQFNQITQQVRQDQELEQKLLDVMRSLQ
ncbi:MAG: DUF4168 domain-containing protein [Gloeocapsa sp. DLM2.Bin57]|nr:MAG: DUF4168 domain-containing protein [Gloeocapsa sp. DLM2.Bin57]